MMRDSSTNRAGFDRVLMAVAATFLAVSATSVSAVSALAGQSDTPRASAAELAIDAAVPRPEPANIPPPTAGDFKADTTASVPDTKVTAPSTTATAVEPKVEPKAEVKPADVVTAPAAATTTPAVTAPPAATATAPAAEPVKAASNVPAADQPVAEKLRDMLGQKSLHYFDRKADRAAVEKFYSVREYAPQWTQAC